MERAEQLATIPADFGWSEVGGWAGMWEISLKDEHGNVVHGDHLGVATHGSLVLGIEQAGVHPGAEDLVVIDLPDALLICPRDRADQLKSLVEELQRDPQRSGLL